MKKFLFKKIASKFQLKEEPDSFRSRDSNLDSIQEKNKRRNSPFSVSSSRWQFCEWAGRMFTLQVKKKKKKITLQVESFICLFLNPTRKNYITKIQFIMMQSSHNIEYHSSPTPNDYRFSITKFSCHCKKFDIFLTAQIFAEI